MPKKINWKPIKKECKGLYVVGATNQEVADYFEVSLAAIKKNKSIQAIRKQAISSGKLTLRGKMYKKATVHEDFNAMKFLAANNLGMTDKVETINLNQEVQFVETLTEAQLDSKIKEIEDGENGTKISKVKTASNKKN